MTANEQFEERAARFRRDTGYLAPGKSVPMAMASESYDEERNAAWDNWCNLEALTAPSDPLREELAASKIVIDDLITIAKRYGWNGHSPSLVKFFEESLAAPSGRGA